MCLTLPIDQSVTKLINYHSSIFSHSTISSGLNAVAAVLLEDFVKPYCCKKISGYAATLFSKATGKLQGKSFENAEKYSKCLLLKH